MVFAVSWGKGGPERTWFKVTQQVSGRAKVSGWDSLLLVQGASSGILCNSGESVGVRGGQDSWNPLVCGGYRGCLPVTLPQVLPALPPSLQAYAKAPF